VNLKLRVVDALIPRNVKHMKTRKRIPTLCTTRLVKRFSDKSRRLERSRSLLQLKSIKLKTKKLKNVWKRWYFANLVRKSFIRKVDIGIVFVINVKITA